VTRSSSGGFESLGRITIATAIRNAPTTIATAFVGKNAIARTPATKISAVNTWTPAAMPKARSLSVVSRGSRRSTLATSAARRRPIRRPAAAESRSTRVRDCSDGGGVMFQPHS